MKKLSKISSFEDFKLKMNKKEEAHVVTTPTPAICDPMLPKVEEEKIKESKAVVTKQREKLTKINEAAFKMGNDYKVKVTIDLPISLVQEYITKVKEETGKNALDNFSELEIAEQIVQHVVKQNLHIDQIPAALTVGESAQEEISAESHADAAKVAGDFNEEQPLDIEEVSVDGEEIDLNDSDLALETPEGTADIDTESNDGVEDITLDDESTEAGELDMDSDETEIELSDDSAEEPATEGDEKEEGDELPLEDGEQLNLGEEREVENEETENATTSEDETEEESTEEPTQEFEEELELETQVSGNEMTIDEMSFTLRRSGLETRSMSSEEIVDLYNDIFVEEGNKVDGIDENGNIVKCCI